MSCPDGFWCFQLKDLINTLVLCATIVAIVYGPMAAVRIARDHEDEREKRRRKFEIFHNLMKTRRMWLEPQHVASLNLIQTDFYDDAKVIEAYKKYIELLYRRTPAPTQPEDEIKLFFEQQDDGFFEMMHEIGRHLGFSLDKRDLAKYSYSPQGWGTTENQAAQFRHLVIEVLSGKRPLPITQFAASQINEKFPPPPAP